MVNMPENRRRRHDVSERDVDAHKNCIAIFGSKTLWCNVNDKRN